ncbi:hypothetical protein K2X30_10510 [bacterium]|jgi:hypothetical protein|nr:hypothetical protein [bacterium]
MNWEVPNYRARAYLKARRRIRQRIEDTRALKRAESKKSLHVHRTRAQIKVTEKNGTSTQFLPARVILNDLRPESLRLFTSVPVQQGQLITLTIEHPRNFYVQARVVWCKNMPTGTPILTEMPYLYRLQLEFVFKTHSEKNSVKNYCEEIFSNYLSVNRIPIVEV